MGQGKFDKSKINLIGKVPPYWPSHSLKSTKELRVEGIDLFRLVKMDGYIFGCWIR